VLHIRNLPYETTEEELRELCAPFGRLVQSKLNVGANKNQAFVEFPDQASAINMVSYFASSADPAKVRRCYPRLLSCALNEKYMYKHFCSSFWQYFFNDSEHSNEASVSISDCRGG